MRSGVHPWIKDSQFSLPEPAKAEDKWRLAALRKSKDKDVLWLLQVLDETAVGHAQYEEDVDAIAAALDVPWEPLNESPVQECLDKIATLKRYLREELGLEASEEKTVYIEPEEACPVCGCEERWTRTGLLTCECPAPKKLDNAYYSHANRKKTPEQGGL